MGWCQGGYKSFDLFELSAQVWNKRKRGGKSRCSRLNQVHRKNDCKAVSAFVYSFVVGTFS